MYWCSQSIVFTLGNMSKGFIVCGGLGHRDSLILKQLNLSLCFYSEKSNNGMYDTAAEKH